MAESIAMQKTLNELGYKSYEDIVAQFQHNVFSTVYSFTRNRQDAEDLSQEVFLLIYQNLPTFKGGSKLSTWIYRITVNKSIEHTRKIARRKNIADFIPINEKISENVQGSASVDSEVINTANRHMLYSALGGMSQKYTAVITLKYMQNLSIKEIGEVLNMPPKTVETQLYRARAKLKESLEALGYDTEESKNGL